LPGAISLDLQLAADRAKLTSSSFLAAHRDKLVALDEVQYVPEVFAQLRSEIDALRRPGQCLRPHFVNVGERLVKSPKVYVRDSGLLHALLNLPDVNSLIGHPMAGHSWEGLMVEQICALIPRGGDVSFYRTAAGAELDLVVELGSKIRVRD